MAYRKPDLYDDRCPSRGLLGLIGGKWSMLLVCVLRQGPTRTGALKRAIGGISQKMLTQTLRDLERSGLVKRICHDEVPPHVEYQLTSLGRSLSDLVLQIEDWITKHYPRIASVQHRVDVERRAAG